MLLSPAFRFMGSQKAWIPASAGMTVGGNGYNSVMKKYLAAQLSFSFFPFAGIGENINDKARLLCYKFALTKLALAACPDQRDTIKTIQSIARIIDHIADPTLVFNLMRGFGWEDDGRMIGLLS